MEAIYIEIYWKDLLENDINWLNSVVDREIEKIYPDFGEYVTGISYEAISLKDEMITLEVTYDEMD